MKVTVHGIISLSLTFIALVIGIIAIALSNTILAIAYAVLLILGFLTVIYSYCTKCPNRFNCGHVIFGKIARLLPKRKENNYTGLDYSGVISPLLILLFFPQMWLWGITWMFITFWILQALALIEIRQYVCTRCLNSKCALCKNKCFEKQLSK